MTSFKLAQLLRDEPRIDKVVFLIDRKDLDDQTVDEYNSFEKDCVDNSDSTHVLVKQLQDPDRIYNPANLKFGAIHRNALGRGVVSPIYAIFQTSQNSEFIEGIVM